MKVLMIEPEKAPRETEIGNDLKSMQQAVGGYIEAVYPFADPVALVCNEEGKLIGLPLNRKLGDYDILAGTFFICGLSEDNFDSLSPEHMEKYKKMFERPEMFMRLGGHIAAIPMEQEKVSKTNRQPAKPDRSER